MTHDVHRQISARAVRSDLVAALWALRLLLLWLLLYPVYRPLAATPFLQTPTADLALFASGGEELVSLISANAESLSSLVTALTFLAVLAAGHAALAVSLSWVSIARSCSIRDARVWIVCLATLPRFIYIGTAQLVVAFGLFAIWWEFLPVFGGVLVPLVGERRTDQFQLLMLGMVGVLFGASLLLSDLVRAISVVKPALDILEAVRDGLLLLRRQLGQLALQSTSRLVAASMLQLGNIWLIAHFGWLSSARPYWLLACLTTECAAVGGLWLRLSWIAKVQSIVAAVEKTQGELSSIRDKC